jgi:U3 small nucleolar RNA-associated protein 13
MSFDTSSTLLATGSSDFTTKIWDIQSQYCTHNLKGAQATIKCVRFYPDLNAKQQCITACDQGKIRVYDLNTSKMDALLDSHYSSVTCIDYLDSNRLLSSARDKVIIIWDLNTWAKQRTIPIYESIEAFILVGGDKSEDEMRMISMGNEGLLKMWDLKIGKVLYQQEESESLKVLNKRVSRTSAELEMIIVQGLYNEKTQTIVQVTADQMIVFVKYDNEAKAKFSTIKRLIGDHGEILDMQLCAKDESLLAMATNNEFLKIYNLNTWDCKLLKGHTDLIICISVYNDEEVSYVASSSKDSTIRIWRIDNANLESIECVAVCSGHTQDVGSICFSKLGFNFLISGSIDTTLKLWKINEIREFSVKFTVKAHEKDINSVCVSPNDKLIASASSDRTAKIWDVSDGACLAVLRGHKRGIWSVQFSSVDQVNTISPCY